MEDNNINEGKISRSDDKNKSIAEKEPDAPKAIPKAPLITVKADEKAKSEEEKAKPEKTVETEKELDVESLKAELEGFIEAVTEDKPVPVSGKDGLAAIHLARALVRSGREGCPITFE